MLKTSLVLFNFFCHKKTQFHHEPSSKTSSSHKKILFDIGHIGHIGHVLFDFHFESLLAQLIPAVIGDNKVNKPMWQCVHRFAADHHNLHLRLAS